MKLQSSLLLSTLAIAVVGALPVASAQTLPERVTLHAFDAVDGNGRNRDGAMAESPLIRAAGIYYGVCGTGGANGTGTVFTITPAGRFTTLYSFEAQDQSGRNSIGSYPHGLVLARGGSIYGLCGGGGTVGAGTIFRLTTAGRPIIVHSFNTTEGAGPTSGLAEDSAGNFYGACAGGGKFGNGTVYRMTAVGVVTLLHSFAAFDNGSFGNNGDGASPRCSPVAGGDGNFYGTCGEGGKGGDDGDGTVYKITPSGVFTTLHNFGGVDGSTPFAGLTKGNDGNLYGATYFGGINGAGTLFRITPAGVLTRLYSFPNVSGYPINAMILGRDGNFYGTSRGGGSDDDSGNYGGTIFKATPGGMLTTLYSFGFVPYFSPNSGGADPGTLIEDDNGNFFGTTDDGGANESGTAFEFITVAPVITSPTTARGVKGDAFRYQITAIGGAAQFGATNLPTGLAVNAQTGAISGVPQAAGTLKSTLYAYNVGPNVDDVKGTATLTFTITNDTPVITSPDTATATVGRAFGYQITATHSPTSYGAQGTPVGISVSPTTGYLSGTPTTAGTYKLTISASNSAGKGSKVLTLAITN